MGLKIKDLLRIIKEAQQRERYLEELDNRISGYIDARGHLRYDPDKCRREYRKARAEYEDWANKELNIEVTSEQDTDTSEHIYNMRILEKLKEYLDKNPTLRFGQALVTSGILTNVYIHGRKGMFAEDPFYDTSEDTYKKMVEKLEEDNNEGK